MKNNSGMLILGIILAVLGTSAYFRGDSGGTISIFSSSTRYAAGGINSVTTPGEAKFIGACMIIGALFAIYESGYFRGKK